MADRTGISYVAAATILVDDRGYTIPEAEKILLELPPATAGYVYADELPAKKVK